MEKALYDESYEELYREIFKNYKDQIDSKSLQLADLSSQIKDVSYTVSTFSSQLSHNERVETNE